MSYRRDLWEIAAERHGVVTITEAEDAGVPAVEMRKLAHRGALRALGNGVYVHRDIPTTELTEPKTAVTLAGSSAFLHREAVLDLLGIGQFNPPKISVAARRRVRRSLPKWVDFEVRTDITDKDLTQHHGIPMTSVYRALSDIRDRVPPDRWRVLVDQALRRELIDDHDVAELNQWQRDRP